MGLIESIIKDDIRVFPNPCTDKIIVDYGFNKPKEIYLYDLLGNKIYSTTDNFINTADLPKGTYLLQINYETNSKSISISKY